MVNKLVPESRVHGEYDAFGHSVDIYDHDVLAGAPFRNDFGQDSGTAFLFHIGKSWLVFEAYLSSKSEFRMRATD